MSKVITFSTTFPSYHPNKGQYTYFVEKFCKSNKIEYNNLVHEHSANVNNLHFLNRDIEDIISDFILFNLSDPFGYKPKHHTIRGGSRFKVGDYFSPRIWGNDVNPKSKRSGAYHSKQIIIAPDTEIVYAPKIEIYKTSEIIIDGKFYTNFGTKKSEELALNDGLTEEELKHWFQYPKKDLIDSQIICWNKEIKY